MTDPQTTVLYALSTLAQTCAALAALVGAVGLYRLQSLRARREGVLGDISAVQLHPSQATDQLLAGARTRAKDGHPVLDEFLHEYDGASSRIRRSAKALWAIEAWNLLVIFAALVGFNYVPALASSPWTFFLVIWVAAVGTVVVTAYCVFVWTKE